MFHSTFPIKFKERFDIKKACLFLLAFLVVFIPFRLPIADLTTKYIKSLPDILILLLFAWHSISIKFRYKFKLYDFIYIAFIGWAFISTLLINDVGIVSFIFQVRSISIYYILFFIIRNYPLDKKEFGIIVKTLNTVAFALLLFVVVEKITSKDILFSQVIASSIVYSDNYVRAYSMLYNPNTYGAFLAIAFIINLYYNIEKNEKLNPFIYTVLIVSIIFSQSRSSTLALIIGLAILLFSYRKRLAKSVIFNTRNAVSFLLTVSIACTFVYSTVTYFGKIYVSANPQRQWEINPPTTEPTEPQPTEPTEPTEPTQPTETDPAEEEKEYPNTFLGRIMSTFSAKEIKSSKADGRLYRLAKGFEVFSDNPVSGTGFGTFGSAASLSYKPALYKEYYIRSTFYSDNQYIVILVETGIVGTILFLGFLLSLALSFRKDYLKLSFFGMLLIFGLFYNVLEVQIISMLFWFILSLENKEEFSLNKETVPVSDGG